MDPLFALAIASDEKGRGNGGGNFGDGIAGLPNNYFIYLCHIFVLILHTLELHPAHIKPVARIRRQATTSSFYREG